MDCFHPYEIQVNGFPQEVRCGHCLACLSHRQAEWTSRLRIELDSAPEKCYFVTLTYSPESLPTVQPDLSEDPIPAVSAADITKFHMDLRKRFQQGFVMDDTLVRCGFRQFPSRIALDTETKFRFYVTSEYGPHGNRPHYHGFYAGLPDDESTVQCLIQQVWNKGFTKVEKARSEAAAAYVAKYLVNDSLVPLPEGAPRPFARMSKGLGASYLENERLVRWHTADPATRAYIPHEGGKQVLPRYLRDKIFVDQETGEDLRPIIMAGSMERNDARLAAEAALSRDELLRKRDDEYHREQEAIRQAKWRFQKNGKIK